MRDVLADTHHAEVRAVCQRNFCLDYNKLNSEQTVIDCGLSFLSPGKLNSAWPQVGSVVNAYFMDTENQISQGECMQKRYVAMRTQQGRNYTEALPTLDRIEFNLLELRRDLVSCLFHHMYIGQVWK